MKIHIHNSNSKSITLTSVLLAAVLALVLSSVSAIVSANDASESLKANSNSLRASTTGLVPEDSEVTVRRVLESDEEETVVKTEESDPYAGLYSEEQGGTPAEANSIPLFASRQTCAGSTTEAECESFRGCEWFAPLSQCIDRNLEACWPLEREDCNNVRGCRYFNEDREFLPSYIRKDTPVRSIGCRKQTMCSLLPRASQCTQYQACDWIDGRCQHTGTPPDPNFFPKCWEDGKYSLTCNQLNLGSISGQECEWVAVETCLAGDCETVRYGCRHRPFCDFDKGSYIRKQCATNSDCVWTGGDNGFCERPPPTTSPTPAPPTPAPTPAPTTLSPTPAPTTPSPIVPTPLACPTTDQDNTLIRCEQNPAGEYQPPNQDRGDTPIAEYCGSLCLDNPGPTASNPFFPGCWAWSWFKNEGVCRLRGCYPDGTGYLQSTTNTGATSWRSGVMDATCFPNDEITASPTVPCQYTNTADPPNFSNQRADQSCVIRQITFPSFMSMTVRERLDWCQQQCSSNSAVDGCVATEYISFPNTKLCAFLSCTTPTQTISSRVYGSEKTDPNCGV